MISPLLELSKKQDLLKKAENCLTLKEARRCFIDQMPTLQIIAIVRNLR